MGSLAPPQYLMISASHSCFHCIFLGFFRGQPAASKCKRSIDDIALPQSILT